MLSGMAKFEAIVRNAKSLGLSVAKEQDLFEIHPFDQRNVHPSISAIIIKLFDDGHHSQATFEAFKYLDKEVQKLSSSSESGYKLMMQAFSESSPLIKLTNIGTVSEKDEQQGYKFIFSGAVMAIRNPRGHEYSVSETIDQCLDHLSLASMLLRRLDNKK